MKDNTCKDSIVTITHPDGTTETITKALVIKCEDLEVGLDVSVRPVNITYKESLVLSAALPKIGQLMKTDILEAAKKEVENHDCVNCGKCGRELQ